MSVWGLLAVFASVTTIPILAALGYSVAAVPRRPGDYFRLRELSSQELVDAPSRIRGRQATLTLCTSFSALHKPLISGDFSKIRQKGDSFFRRFNLEQLRVFVKHWSPHLIRPEVETRHAGEPT
ncbi:MAG TPA: hypothetical protein VJY34_27965 [Roseiarcus sp.]|nr:hypothetical protein [Roseiarcus sp.]